jgi:hypothetical protein
VGAEQGVGIRPFLARRIEESPALRSRLRAARASGVSDRRFGGWEPTTTTTYEYDDQNRIVRSTTLTEPEFDDEQRGLMLALQVYEDLRCDGCGGNLEETTAPENEGRYRVSKSRCHKCDAIGIAAEQHDKDGAPRMHAVKFRTQLLPPSKQPRIGG